MSVSYESLFAELNQDPEVWASGEEYRLRQELAAILEKRRAERGLSMRAMAREMDTSLSQVQRLFQEEHGGSLTLRTLVRAAKALDMRFHFYEAYSEPDSISGRLDNTSWGTFSELGRNPACQAKFSWQDDDDDTSKRHQLADKPRGKSDCTLTLGS